MNWKAECDVYTCFFNYGAGCVADELKNSAQRQENKEPSNECCQAVRDGSGRN